MSPVWQTLDVGGKRAELFVPAAPVQRGLLFLHGHGLTTLAGNRTYTDLLGERGFLTLCPHGQRSWWGRRICREFDPAVAPADYLLQSVLPWFESEWGLRPPSIGLFGVSMGGQGALRLAYWHPRLFPVVAALAPAVDFQIWHGRGLPLDEMYSSPEQCRQDTATLILHPLNWPRFQFLACDPDDDEWFDGTERLVSKLYSSGIPHTADLTTRAGGHSWEYFDRMAARVVEFLDDGIGQCQSAALLPVVE